MVLTSRDASAFSDVSNVRRFVLSPLTAEQTEELVAALDPNMSATERAGIHRRCDGVPFYIEEVVAKVREQPTDAAQWASVPDTLYEALFAKLRASDNAIPVVQAAATIGRDFDRNLLSLIVDVSDQEFDAAIRQLEDAMVFEPSGLDHWRFRHELLREVAYELPRRACDAHCTPGSPTRWWAVPVTTHPTGDSSPSTTTGPTESRTRRWPTSWRRPTRAAAAPSTSPAGI